MDKSRVLVVSHHHKRSVFFEDTMWRLWDAGYKKIFIQNTGIETWGKYQGPGMLRNLGIQSYDQAQQNLYQAASRSSDAFDYIVWIDNDCWLSSLNHFEQYLQDFIDGGYDFSSHFVSGKSLEGYNFQGKTIVPVQNQQFLHSEHYPGFCPEPHWENAYMIMKFSSYLKLSNHDVSHGRLWLKAIHDHGMKMGVHQANYLGSYTHYGTEWFHMGYFMAYMSKIEDRFMDWNLDSEQDMFRLGCIIEQGCIYGHHIYPHNINLYFDSLPLYIIQKATSTWHKFVEGTCMAKWIPYKASK